MNAFKIFSESIKPELNLLYTVPPFKRDGEFDCGWYCREHAFHCFVLAQMLGVPSTIIVGDFVVHAGNGLPNICSLDCSSDHAWCQIGDVCPLDLSATFRLFGGGHILVGPQLNGAVLGCGKNGDFTITYTKDEKAFRQQVAKPELKPWFGLLERQRLSVRLNDILDDPFIFLHRPQKDGWAEIHGANIFSKISLHLYKVFKGEIKPLNPNHSPDSALSAIKARYGAATQKIKRIMQNVATNTVRS